MVGLMSQPPFHIVLVHPEIPNNTGTIGRTAAATGCRLHIVHPIGFSMDQKARRRAGLDYWAQVDCHEHASWQAFLDAESPQRGWALTARAERPVWGGSLQRGDYLLFGRESAGLPEEILAWAVEAWGPESVVGLPMAGGLRSLNLACAATAVAYEGLRQLDGADPA